MVLKPCPFCGGQPYIVSWRDEKERKNPTSIKCVKCGAKTDVYDRIKDAKSAWNRRANDGTYI